MYKFEPFVLEAFCIQIVGFMLLLNGNFVYNEIIELKCCGLNRKMKKYNGDGYKKHSLSQSQYRKENKY